MFAVPKEMRAVVYRGIDDLRLEHLPVPRISPGELLVKVAACGVCPTDIKKIHYGTVEPPRVFGHETAGTIVKLGAKIRGFRVGERVGLHHHVPCLQCHACRHRAFAQCAQYKRTGITAGFEPAGGGYAEYVRVLPFVLPGVVKIPSRNTFLDGAMLEPVNTVLKAVERLAILSGDNVLVAGQGPIGLMFTRLLALKGMNVIATDLLDSRLQLARDFGAKWLWNHKAQRGYLANGKTDIQKAGSALTNPLKIRSLKDMIANVSSDHGLDAAVIAVPSNEAVREAHELLRGGGQLLLFSHTRRGEMCPLDLASVCVDEKDVIGSYSADFTLQKAVARVVFSGELNVRRLITHEFPLEQTAAAVQLASAPNNGSLKIIVNHQASHTRAPQFGQ